MLKKRISYWIGHYWVEFDNVYLKYKLIHNWPEVKNESDAIANRIRDVIHKYMIEKNNPLVHQGKYYELEDKGIASAERADRTPPQTGSGVKSHISSDSLFNNLNMKKI